MGKVFFCSEPLIMLNPTKCKNFWNGIWHHKILWRGEDVKKVQVGETDSLNPSKRDEICFWYIKEFWKWNMMSRYSARYHGGGRGGEESTRV